MSKVKKIMVALDFSEYSNEIANYAGQLAEELGAELIFVNVINQRDIDMIKQITIHTDKISVKGYINGLIDDRTEQMQRLLTDTSCTRIPNRFLIKKGVPFAELIETAKEGKPDQLSRRINYFICMTSVIRILIRKIIFKFKEAVGRGQTENQTLVFKASS